MFHHKLASDVAPGKSNLRELNMMEVSDVDVQSCLVFRIVGAYQVREVRRQEPHISRMYTWNVDSFSLVLRVFVS
jgi:hypothetical protein